MTQQARQFSWHLQEREPGSIRYLLHDRDGTFAAEGIEAIRTSVRAPNANAVAEQMVRSIRAECLDRLLILNQPHLLFVLKQYLADDNHHRPHQDLGQQQPVPIVERPQAPAVPEHMRCRPVLGGLLHDYAVAA